MILRVVVDDQVFEASYSTITAARVAEFNRHVHVTVRQALSDPACHDLDIAAGLAWLTMPDGVPLIDVLRAVTLDATCVVQIDEEEVPDGE